MDTHAARLDANEQFLQQLHSDVAGIKASLVELEKDRVESAEFRKTVLAWMKSQEKKHVHDSSRSTVVQLPLPDHSLELSAGSVSPPLSLLAQLEAMVAKSEERWMQHQEKKTGDGSSESRFFGEVLSGTGSKSESLSASKIGHVVDHSSDSSSLPAILPAITTRSLFGSGENLLRYEIPSVQAILELKSVVDLDYPASGLGVEQKMVMSQNFSDLDLCEKGKTPFDRGKDSLYHRALNGKRFMFSVIWTFWVVHGQPRPPEDASEDASTGIPRQVSDQVLRTRLY